MGLLTEVCNATNAGCILVLKIPVESLRWAREIAEPLT